MNHHSSTPSLAPSFVLPDACALAQKFQSLPYRMHVSKVLPSTNAHLLNEGRAWDGLVALEQTQGRTQKKDDAWHSPKNLGLYFSLAHPILKKSAPFLSSTANLSALCLFEALAPLNIEGLKIKWPNDLVVESSENNSAKSQKLAGILVELRQNPSKLLVIGVGLNVNIPPNAKISQAHTSLLSLGIQNFDANDFLCTFSRRLYQNWRRFQDEGFLPFREKYEQYLSYKQGQKLVWQQNNDQNSMQDGVKSDSSQHQIVRFEGIDNGGAACVMDEAGNRHTLHSAHLRLLRDKGSELK